MDEQNVMMDSGQDILLSSWKRVNGIAAEVFALAVLAGLPLVFHDYYFDILDTKYWFYCGVIISMAVTFAVIALIFLWRDRTLYQGKIFQKLTGDFSFKTLKFSDWAMLAFLAMAVISTFQSEYFYESFWGNEGRYCGLFLIILYTFSFFIISKCLVLKKWHLDVFLAAAMIVCLIGILHYFKLDPLGFKNDLGYQDNLDFTSTLGNINTYTSYLALVVGISTVMFAIEKEKGRKIWYTLCMVVSLFALITGISDNAYLTLIALLFFLPFYLFNNIKGIRSYIIILAVLCTEFVVIGTIVDRIPDHVIAINGLFNVITDFKLLPVLTAVLWFIACGLWAGERGIWREAKNTNIGRWIWLFLSFIAFGVLGRVLYEVNILGEVEKYGSLEKYLLFNDDWGTHRGYIWNLAMRIYSEFPIIHKIFGYGPDTFGIITVQNFYEEMISLYSEKFENVHNEYLQYLLTVGIAGVTAYITLIASSIIKMIRESSQRPMLMAIAMAVICYAAQAVVNISTPIVTPVMLTLLMMGLSAYRQSE